ncbi:MAG: hypothetical protein V4610_18260 [Pseudomonadota bacterium]|jgi:hypothetical protein|uniref:Uncharacterized protein n=1 Tax=hydrothermal vent metagenome TaxID=652676 RepID=A0A160TPF9_9ZZZZ
MRKTAPAVPAEEYDEPWYIQRAEQALELAQRAEHPAVVHAHYLMAEAYLERMGDPGEEPSSEAA